MSPTLVTREQVTLALRAVFDPEMGMSIVDLGLVYRIDIDEGLVRITMTLTTPGCPLHDAMGEWVRQAVERISGVDRAMVVFTFEPPWTPDRLSRAARP